MGFCLHNNAAVAALAAQAAGARKVLIVDWVGLILLMLTSYHAFIPFSGLFTSLTYIFLFLFYDDFGNYYCRMFIMEMVHKKYLSRTNR